MSQKPDLNILDEKDCFVLAIKYPEVTVWVNALRDAVLASYPDVTIANMLAITTINDNEPNQTIYTRQGMNISVDKRSTLYISVDVCTPIARFVTTFLSENYTSFRRITEELSFRELR